MTALKKTALIYNKVEEACMVVIFAVMIVTIGIEVFFRYVLNNSLPWPDELAKFIFMWLTWIGISVGARDKEHIAITMLVEKFPYRVAQVISILANIVVIIICALTIYYTLIVMGTVKSAWYVSLHIRLFWGYIPIVLGCGLTIIRIVFNIIDSIKGIHRGYPLDETEQMPIEFVEIEDKNEGGEGRW